MKSRAIRSVLLLAISAGVVVPAGAWGGAHAARGHAVTLKNIRFHPGNLSINRGDSVTWLWRDGGTEHNVTGHGFHSRTQAHGSFTVRFTHSGTFNYHCTIHVSKGMRGKIVVH
jgi:plastocyanin